MCPGRKHSSIVMAISASIAGSEDHSDVYQTKAKAQLNSSLNRHSYNTMLGCLSRCCELSRHAEKSQTPNANHATYIYKVGCDLANSSSSFASMLLFFPANGASGIFFMNLVVVNSPSKGHSQQFPNTFYFPPPKKRQQPGGVRCLKGPFRIECQSPSGRS